MYLLDTDHCIFLMRHLEPVCRQLEQRATASVSVSIITVSELLFGAYWSARPAENCAATRELIDSQSVLPLTETTVDRFARIKVDLLRGGHRLEDPDLFIAATAMEHELVLVTHNSRHYERIAGLRIEDWHA